MATKLAGNPIGHGIACKLAGNQPGTQGNAKKGSRKIR